MRAEQPLPLNLAEYEAAAAALLPKAVYDDVAGGAGDEVSLRDNRAAFDRWRLLPRVMTGASAPRLATTVLGQPTSMPVLTAPSAFHRLVHPDGELASAAAARRADVVYTMSTGATYPIEEVAPRAGRWWFQLYVYRDRAVTRDLVARAEAAGASALVVTVDTLVVGRPLPTGVLRGTIDARAATGMATAPLPAPQGPRPAQRWAATSVRAKLPDAFAPDTRVSGGARWVTSSHPLPLDDANVAPVVRRRARSSAAARTNSDTRSWTCSADALTWSQSSRGKATESTVRSRRFPGRRSAAA